MTWWHDEAALSRFVHDLVDVEIGRSRPGGGPLLPERPWAVDMPIGREGLGADSLELMNISSALSEALCLARSGLEDGLLAYRTLRGWINVCSSSLARFDQEIVFRSSGSTGNPKSSRHRIDALAQEVETLSALLSGRRILGAVPCNHIYGFLFTVLLPHRLDAPVVDIRQRSPETLGSILAPGDVVVGHPAWWQVFLRAAPPIPRELIAITSTAPCPEETFEELLAAGFSRVIEIYGASELAGIGWRDQPGTAFNLMTHWARGDEISIIARRFPDGTNVQATVPDRIRWLDARRFVVEGRHDGAIQVGGTNVFPQFVRDKLRSHPLVAEAAVRLMRADEGHRLKAFVVLQPDASPLEARGALVRWIETNLPVAERPKSLTFGTALPTGSLDKSADW